MDKRIAKLLIAENQRMIQNVEMVKRNISFESHSNYVLVGLRRAGKSYLLYQRAQEMIALGHLPEEILYFNFEDDRLENLQLSDLDAIKQAYEEMYGYQPIFMLDEIQIIDGWEKFARRLADQKYRVYITGSNAKILLRLVADIWCSPSFLSPFRNTCQPSIAPCLRSGSICKILTSRGLFLSIFILAVCQNW